MTLLGHNSFPTGITGLGSLTVEPEPLELNYKLGEGEITSITLKL